MTCGTPRAVPCTVSTRDSAVTPGFAAGRGAGTPAPLRRFPQSTGRRPPPARPIPAPGALAFVSASRSFSSGFAPPAVPLLVDPGSDPGGDRLTATHPGASCRATAAQADAWIDGALPVDARAAVDGHLRACPLCRASVAALYRLVTAVRRQAAHQPPAPASLRARVQALTARWRAAEAAADAADAPAAVAPAVPGRPVR